MTRDDALESLRLRFTSGNSVPVNRASINRDEYEALAAAPKPAAPPSVTEAVSALLAKMREYANRLKPLGGNAYTAAHRIESYADELQALTHPGHKHAQEDNRIDRGAVSLGGQPESWDAVDEALWCWYGHKLTFTQSERRRFFDAIQAYLKHAQEDAAQEDDAAELDHLLWERDRHD